MNYLIYLLLILPFIAAPTSCTTVKAELPAEEPWVINVTPTPTAIAAPDDRIDKLLERQHEMRYGQVILIIHQVCTIDGEINSECRKSVMNCYTDIWKPTTMVIKCVEEWRAAP